jgi:hypothetical protein
LATTLYEVVRDNLETLYVVFDDGAVKVVLPRFVRKELEGHLDCGLLCRGSRGCDATRARRRALSRKVDARRLAGFRR